jgi:hypothetical protein
VLHCSLHPQCISRPLFSLARCRLAKACAARGTELVQAWGNRSTPSLLCTCKWGLLFTCTWILLYTCTWGVAALWLWSAGRWRATRWRRPWRWCRDRCWLATCLRRSARSCLFVWPASLSDPFPYLSLSRSRSKVVSHRHLLLAPALYLPESLLISPSTPLAPSRFLFGSLVFESFDGHGMSLGRIPVF